MYNNLHHKFNWQWNHKFGLHIGGPTPSALQAALKMRPRVLKVMDFSTDFLKRFRAENPDAFVIGRLFQINQHFGLFPETSRKRGQELADRVVAAQPDPGLINAWEGLNEVLAEGASDEQHLALDEFQVAFLERLRGYGFEGVAWNFGTGHGDGEKWLRCYPGTLEVYKYLGFHEYDWPLARLHNQGLAEGNGGEWLALRYRRVMRPILEQYGNAHTVIITEVGVTNAVLGGPDEGWRRPGGFNLNDYLTQLYWYNTEIMKDPFVMGAVLFTAGGYGWSTHEVTPDVSDAICGWQQKLPFCITPSPTDTPGPPQPEQPRPDGWNELLRKAAEKGFQDGWTACATAVQEYLKGSYSSARVPEG